MYNKKKKKYKEENKVPLAHSRFIFANLANHQLLQSRLKASVLPSPGRQQVKPSAMTEEQNVYPGLGESNPLHTSVYGPPPSGFGVPPPSYSQVPGGPYPPAAGYGQPGFPLANAGFAPGPPQMPYPQGPYPQGPYPQGPYPHGSYRGGPVQTGFSGNPSGDKKKY